MSNRSPFLTVDRVHAVMDQLAAAREDPANMSLGKLRAKLGSGSLTTVGKHKDTWRRPMSSPVAATGGPANTQPLPPPPPLLQISQADLNKLIEEGISASPEIAGFRSELATQVKLNHDLKIRLEEQPAVAQAAVADVKVMLTSLLYVTEFVDLGVKTERRDLLTRQEKVVAALKKLAERYQVKLDPIIA